MARRLTREQKQNVIVAYITLILIGIILIYYVATESPSYTQIETYPIDTTVEMETFESTQPTIEVKTLVNEKDKELLAKLIEAESGADWCSDRMQLYVGSVVLNRIDSDQFPNDMESVIYQEGQYSTAGCINYIEPSDRAIKNAEYLMKHGAVLDGYVWQANFSQGSDVIQVENMYFGRE